MTKYILVLCETFRLSSGTESSSTICEIASDNKHDQIGFVHGKYGTLIVSIPKKGGVVINYKNKLTK